VPTVLKLVNPSINQTNSFNKGKNISKDYNYAATPKCYRIKRDSFLPRNFPFLTSSITPHLDKIATTNFPNETPTPKNIQELTKQVKVFHLIIKTLKFCFLNNVKYLTK